jgi:phosphoglycolate phosphatase-like HAD superfamily hydrolase
MINKYKLAVYDLDGTVADTADDVVGILNNFRIKYSKKKPLAKEKYFPWLSLGGIELIMSALEVNTEDAKNYLNLFRKEYISLTDSKVTAFPNIDKTLKILKKKQIYTAICTNKPRNLTLKVLEHLKLTNMFDFIHAGDDQNQKKPHPSTLQNCINFFNVKPVETIFIGDSKIDQSLSKSLMVDFAYFESGYNDGVNLDDVSYIFKNHDELIEVLRKENE